MKQLPLPIQLDQRATFDSFIEGGNAAVVSQLKALVSDQGEDQIYIWSSASRGKTHLLQAVCHLAAAENMRAGYFPLGDLMHFGPGFLQGLEQLRIICLDDVERVWEDERWAGGLFHFMNRCRTQGCKVLVAADQGPHTLSGSLTDLASRFSRGAVFELKSLQDDELREFVVCWGRGRGFELPEDVVSFLLLRTCRDIQLLVKLVDRLDAEALAQKRRITVRFTKSVLGL